MYFPLDFGHRSMAVFQNLLIGLADCCLYCLQKQHRNWTGTKTFLVSHRIVRHSELNLECVLNSISVLEFDNNQEAEFKIHIWMYGSPLKIYLNNNKKKYKSKKSLKNLKHFGFMNRKDVGGVLYQSIV